ncbi:MAG TPA: DUF423 domain-containing protein [Gemmatimonadetes bacterium]|jgi:uncharacterized membrane protein YgdD (TMEM256/DUF423 family)|nr:DUF423 domain-containing protein [Gemmatimonadota bacterium]
MERIFALTGCLFALTAVAIGAFGAHFLQSRLPSISLVTLETAVKYQMYHAFALFFVTYALGKWPSVMAPTSGWLFLAGTILFSGSLYILIATEQRWVGMLTPIGGTLLIIGWVNLIFNLMKT